MAHPDLVPNGGGSALLVRTDVVWEQRADEGTGGDEERRTNKEMKVLQASEAGKQEQRYEEGL